MGAGMDYDAALSWKFADARASWGERETILYALGLGLGWDPVDRHQLRFVTESDLLALPTLLTVVGRNPPWLPKVGVRVTDAVHGEQHMVFDRGVPSSGSLVGKTIVSGIVDKGAGRGVLILTESQIYEEATGQRLCTSVQTSFIRGIGGFGKPSISPRTPHPIPDRAPDAIDDFPTIKQAPLIYRQSGDRNPLHFDPDIARAAGFPRPIMHGLCTYGIAGWQIIKTFCAHDPARLKALDVRFAAPVLPGELLRTQMWLDGQIVSFCTHAVDRDVVVLSNGRAVRCA
jgi:acyl dehydratase